MSVLFHWKWTNYVKDTGWNTHKYAIKDYNLTQDNELMYSLKPGEHIWAFTRWEEKTYVLAADLIVTKTVTPSPNPQYGLYCAYGDRQNSRYFNVNAQRNVEPLIKSLDVYVNKKGQTPKVRAMGSFSQGPPNGVRLLPTSRDEQQLIQFSSGLPVI